MSKFIGYTVGLDATSKTGKSVLAKVGYYSMPDGTVKLVPASGRNLSEITNGVKIPKAEFDARPRDPYNDTREAVWALERCGFTV